jgi:copper chaperone CopZ
VAGVEVNLGKKSVDLTLKEGQTLEDERINEIVKDAGYDPLGIRREKS